MKSPMKYFSIIGVILFIIILSKIDLSQLLSILLKADYLLVLLAFVMSSVEVGVRVIKWKVIVNVFNKGYRLVDSLRTYLIGFAFGAVTPAKTGDILKIVDLKERTGIEMKKCFSISVFDRIVDFSNLVLTAVLGTSVAIFVFPGLDYMLFPILLVSLAILVSLLFGLTRHSKTILKPFYYFIPKKLKAKAKDVYYSFREIIHVAKKHHTFMPYLFLNFSAWVVATLVPYFLALSLGLEVKFIYFLLLMPVVGIVEVLPISLLGIGSRDLTLIILFSPLGLVKEEIIGISMLLLIVSMVPRAIVGLIMSVKRKNAAKKHPA